MTLRSNTRSFLMAAAALAVLPALSLAQTPPPHGPGGPHGPHAEKTGDRAEAVPLEGTVVGYNLNAAGDYDSAELKTADGQTVQVNFPPHVGKPISDAAAVGSTTKVTARPAKGTDAHKVYALVTHAGSDGNQVPLPPPPPRKEKDHDDKPDPKGDNPHPKDPGEPGKVEGTVKTLNHAHDGRVDGAVLDNGTFVHTGPKAAEMLKLDVGQKVTAEGHQKVGKSGINVLHAAKVNGTELPKPPKPKKDKDDHDHD